MHQLERDFSRTNDKINKVYQEGKLEVFLYHYFSRLIIQAKSEFLIDPSIYTFQKILAKIQKVILGLQLRRNYRIQNVQEIHTFNNLELQEMLLQCVVYPYRQDLSGGYGGSCVNWAIFYAKFFEEIGKGDIKTSIGYRGISIHVFAIIEYQGRYWEIDMFSPELVKEIKKQDIPKELFSRNEVEKYTAVTYLNYKTYFQGKRLELDITTAEDYDRLSISIISGNTRWTSKRVFSRVMEQIDIDKFQQIDQLFPLLIEKKDIPNDIHNAIKIFYQIMTVQEVKDFLKKAG